MKSLIRTKYLSYHPSAKRIMDALSDYREEVEVALKRFRDLDFGIADKKDLNDNTMALAEESGMLVGRYKTDLGYTDIIHNLDFGKTIVLFIYSPPKCSHFGF